MNTIFTTDDPENYSDKLNLDDLYEKKKQHDISTTANYNTILNRIHSRIKTTSRLQLTEQHCWFIIPEMMIGVPKFDSASCIAYIIDKLQINGFNVRYTHPNLLFISWSHWVPDYVRTEIKKKTGVIVDGYGNVLNTDGETTNNNSDSTNPDTLLLKNSIKSKEKEKDNDTKEITSYKPSGQLIYNNDILNSFKSK
jgi:hypothetical protein